MAITIIGDGWNLVSTESTQILAEHVYEVFVKFIGYELEHDIIVLNDPLQGYALAHYDKKDDKWQITLSTPSGAYWAQIAYQLSHEICHLYCNHAQSRGHKHKWLEESFCECASIAVLDRLGHDWRATRMAAYNSNYGLELTKYIQNVKDGVHEPVNNPAEFTEWLTDKIALLEDDSELRDFNRVVALYIYASKLHNHPVNWLAITSLNKWDCHQDQNFTDFIDSWSAASNANATEAKSVIALLS